MNPKLSVIIISYDFPPRNITASQRPVAWIKYLPQYGIRPIIITRQWDEHDKVREEYSKETHLSHDVYKINCSKTFATKYEGDGDLIRKMSRKISKWLDLPLKGNLIFSPLKEFYEVSKMIISQTSGPKVLLITVQPFEFLKLGYVLHRETGIPWVADYRDDWTTTELPINGWLKKFFYKAIYPRKEIKWLSSARFILSVSPYYVKKITSFLGKSPEDGLSIPNGYFEEEISTLSEVNSNEKGTGFVYVGSLYESQDVDVILKCLKEAVNHVMPHFPIVFSFLGTSMLPRIKEKLLSRYSGNGLSIRFYVRMPKKQALKIQRQHPFGILCSHPGLKGIPSSKLYEFVGLKMPVVFYPNDNDIIHETLNSCALGITAGNEQELVQVFEDIIRGKIQPHEFGNENVKKFSRRASTQKLADKLLAAFVDESNEQ